MVLNGDIVLPVEHVKEPIVDANDIADIAVVTLTEDTHRGQLYELAGPRLFTAITSEGIRRAIRA